MDIRFRDDIKLVLLDCLLICFRNNVADDLFLYMVGETCSNDTFWGFPWAKPRNSCILRNLPDRLADMLINVFPRNFKMDHLFHISHIFALSLHHFLLS